MGMRGCEGMEEARGQQAIGGEGFAHGECEGSAALQVGIGVGEFAEIGNEQEYGCGATCGEQQRRSRGAFDDELPERPHQHYQEERKGYVDGKAEGACQREGDEDYACDAMLADFFFGRFCFGHSELPGAGLPGEEKCGHAADQADDVIGGPEERVEPAEDWIAGPAFEVEWRPAVKVEEI